MNHQLIARAASGLGLVLLTVFVVPHWLAHSVSQAAEMTEPLGCRQRLALSAFALNNNLGTDHLREILLIAEHKGSDLLVVKEGTTPIAIIDVGPLPSRSGWWSPPEIKIRNLQTPSVKKTSPTMKTPQTGGDGLTSSSTWPEFARYLSGTYQISLDNPVLDEMKTWLFNNPENRHLIIRNSQNVEQGAPPIAEKPPETTNLVQNIVSTHPQWALKTNGDTDQIHLGVSEQVRFFSFQWNRRVFLNRLLSIGVSRPNPSGTTYVINLVFETAGVNSSNDSSAIAPHSPLDIDIINEVPRVLSKGIVLRPGFIQINSLSRTQSLEHFARGSQGEPERLNLADLIDYPERAPSERLLRKADENMFLSLGNRIEPEPLAPFGIPLLEGNRASGFEQLLSEWDDHRLYYWAVDLDGRFLMGPGNFLDNLGSKNYLHLLVGQKPARMGGFVTRAEDTLYNENTLYSVYIDTQIYGFGPDAPTNDEKVTWLDELTPVLERLFQRNVSADFQIKEVGFAAINPGSDAPQ